MAFCCRHSELSFRSECILSVVILVWEGPSGSLNYASFAQERRDSPKRKFSGRASRGRPGVIRADVPISGSRTVPTRRLFKESAPFAFFILMGSFAQTLFSSNTSVLTNPLFCRANSTARFSNTSFGRLFWGPLARTNFLSGLCGLPTTPPQKITYAKKILRNYFRGDCDTFA